MASKASEDRENWGILTTLGWLTSARNQSSLVPHVAPLGPDGWCQLHLTDVLGTHSQQPAGALPCSPWRT